MDEWLSNEFTVLTQDLPQDWNWIQTLAFQPSDPLDPLQEPGFVWDGLTMSPPVSEESTGPETAKWLLAIVDETVSLKAFIHQVSNMLVSNIGRFMGIFQEPFPQWIEWMKSNDWSRLREYLKNAAHRQILKHCPERRECLLTLAHSHFIHFDKISARFAAYIHTALSLFHEIGGDTFGFCPKECIEYSSYYPFHLTQLVRASLTRSCRRGWESQLAEFQPTGDFASKLMAVNSLASEAWFASLGHETVLEMGPFYIIEATLLMTPPLPSRSILIQPFLWPSVYSDCLPFEMMFAQDIQTQTRKPPVDLHSPYNIAIKTKVAYEDSEHHLTMYRDFELFCARMVSQVMKDFAVTALKDSIKPLKHASVGELKQAVWDFVERGIKRA